MRDPFAVNLAGGMANAQAKGSDGCTEGAQARTAGYLACAFAYLPDTCNVRLALQALEFRR